MKVLFYCINPFFLAHGGTQTLLESLMREIRAWGVEVEPARWWDASQTGDILHFMNRPTRTLVKSAREKRFRCVMTENIDQTASRTPLELWLRKSAFQLDRALGGHISERLNLEVYKLLDASVYAVELERHVAHYLYGAPLEKSFVIPQAVDADAVQALAQPETEGDYLLFAGTLIPRKNPVLLARAAKLARVPIVFLGKPFNESDPYFQEFRSLVDGEFVRYPGFVSQEEKHRLLRGARGFALLSQFESGCIAVHEASAAGLPLFLPHLPWASKVYTHARAKSFVNIASAEMVAPALRAFYEHAHRLKGQTFPVMTWRDVARRYVDVYERIAAR